MSHQVESTRLVANHAVKTRTRSILGFDWHQLTSWTRLVRLLNRPEDPSALAVFRIMFGILMMLDIPNERGMSEADYEYGNASQCIFPLFDFLKPLAVQWMLVLYAIMFMGAFGIAIGFKYRAACLCFAVPYWYIFLLDKTTWNNHSYLYGLISINLLLIDANRYLSVDSWLDNSIRNTHVPLWNYCALRSQVFLVYFIAGLKKIDYDWINGYSMSNLASHWIFDPFKVLLTHDQITVLVVHGGGLFIDLFSGFLLFFDRTRLLGTLFTTSFHIMNSRMFSIGMFPYTMLATTTLFYSNQWPKQLCTKRKDLNSQLDENGCFRITKLSQHCIYEKPNEELTSALGVAKANLPSKEKLNSKKTSQQPKHSFYHNVFSLYVIVYLALQCFLPYSHFITKGYNNWTNGLYGYSWDMMVHSWHTQHIKISFVDKQTGQTHYLNPKAWTTRKRWSSHGDMIYQYAHCIRQRLAAHNFTDVELYVDVWRSMNHRFNQRQVDPRVDLLRASWSPLQPTDWIIPLQTGLSEWRAKLHQIETELKRTKQDYELTFVADLHGLKLENYVSEYLNASIEVLKGEISVEVELELELEKQQQQSDIAVEKDINADVGSRPSANKSRQAKGIKESNQPKAQRAVSKRNITLGQGEKLELKAGAYHTVYTISTEPSCYFYIYINETAILISDMFERFTTNMMHQYNQTLLELKKKDAENTDDNGNKQSSADTQRLVWKAYNLTVMASSRNFLHMISFNSSEPDPAQTAQAMSATRNLFAQRRYNESVVYQTFVKQFYNNFNDRMVKSTLSMPTKLIKKIKINMDRFQQSFTMVFYALKSIYYGQDFMKLIYKEYFNSSSFSEV